MRALITCVCCFGIVAGCGRAEGDGPKGSGGNSAAQGGAGSGSAPMHVGGAAMGGAPAGAGKGGLSGDGMSGSDAAGDAAGALSSAGSSGSAATGTDNPCGAGDFFVKINGELPGGFGTDQKLTFGCPDARPGVFAVPVSFTRPPPEGGGIEIGVVACDGGAFAVRFDQSPAFHNFAESNSLSYAVDGAWRSFDVMELSISEQPVADWTALRSGSKEGVGKVYAGSFQAQGTPAGSQLTVTGTFRVCHVANLDVP